MAFGKKVTPEEPSTPLAHVGKEPDILKRDSHSSASAAPKPPSSRAACQEAMDAKHAEIAKIEGWLVERKAELDALIQLNNQLPK